MFCAANKLPALSYGNDLMHCSVFLPGPVTTRTPALFVPGVTGAPILSLDLLSAAGQGDHVSPSFKPPVCSLLAV